MKAIKPVVKKLLQRCIPRLKAKRATVSPDTSTNSSTNAKSETPPIEESLPAAPHIVTAIIRTPVPLLPSQSFEQFFIDFDSRETIPMPIVFAGPPVALTSASSVQYKAVLNHSPAPFDAICSEVPRTVNSPPTPVVHDKREDSNADPAAKAPIASQLPPAHVAMLQKHVELEQQLAQMAKELGEERRQNRLNQEMIETQEAIIFELEEKMECDLDTKKLLFSNLKTEATKESDMLKEIIQAKDKEIERLQATLVRRDEDHQNQIEAKVCNENMEKATATGVATRAMSDLKQKLRDQIVAKRVVEAKLAEAITERSKAIAKGNKEVEAAQGERDRLSELCGKLERKVAALFDTLSVFDSNEQWLKCFDSDASRDALPGHELDHIPFARFFTPVKCTSWENPNAMRLSELGPLGRTPPFEEKRGLNRHDGVAMAQDLPAWTLPLPLRGPGTGDVEL